MHLLNVNSQPCVEDSHRLQGFQKGFNIQVVVILWAISECSHSLLPEHLLAVLRPLLQQETHISAWKTTSRKVASHHTPASQQSNHS